jgi:hypothetical protein
MRFVVRIIFSANIIGFSLSGLLLGTYSTQGGRVFDSEGIIIEGGREIKEERGGGEKEHLPFISILFSEQFVVQNLNDLLMALKMRQTLFVYSLHMLCKQFEIQNLKYVGAGVGLKQNAWEPHSMIVAIQYISNDVHTLQHIMIHDVMYCLYYISIC